ncbi:MAG: histidine phosphatase family protein [Planctomycetota bacterium]
MSQNFIVARPGQTAYDEQQRIKGQLSIPLNLTGASEVAQLVRDLSHHDIVHVACGPCRAAEQTAEAIADDHGLSVTTYPGLSNLDRGLWAGKQLVEIRKTQPKAYKRWQDQPQTICPPDGELVTTAVARVLEVLSKLKRRFKSGVVVVVIPEPLATIVQGACNDTWPDDLWSIECGSGTWDEIQGELENAAVR